MVTNKFVEWQIETEIAGDQFKHIVYRKEILDEIKRHDDAGN